MKILRVISSIDPKAGGVTTAVNHTTAKLRALGVKVELACSDDPASPWLAGERSVHALGPGKYGWSFNQKWQIWLEKNLSRFDAVTIEGLWQYPSWITARTCLRVGRPYYVFPHGMLDPWFQKLRHRPLKAIRNVAYWRLLEETVVNKSSGILFTCEQEMLLARKPFRPYRPSDERVVGLGVMSPPPLRNDMRMAFKSKCPAIQDYSYFLFLSRIHPKKGVDILLKSYRRLLDVNLKVPHLVIAGPGLDTSYGKMCLRLCRSLGLRTERSIEDHTVWQGHQSNGGLTTPNGPLVHFPGMLQGDAKWGAFYGCEAFILPSHQENFGIVVAESLACGKPVMISDQVNIWREIDKSGAGFVEKTSVEGTEASLRRWVETADKDRQEMSVAALACFKANFRIEEAAHKIFEVLKS